MESGEQEFFIQLPRCRSYGPYLCSEGVDIERHILSIAESSNPRVGDTPFRVKLPKSLGEHILVIVYPRPFDGQESAVVYGVECVLGEMVTEDEIRNRLRTSYTTYDDCGRCFCVYKQSEANRLEPSSLIQRYGRGTIFVVADPGSCSPYSTSPLSGYSVAPPTNLPLHHSTNNSHAPITATSGPERAANYVMPNQNLVLANSPNIDDMRKVLAQVDNAPTQALIPDPPHLEQKPPLQNIGDLAGCTALQSVLVTPSTEQHDLAGPLPCSSKDKAPVIIVDSPSEEREAGEREEIVNPQTESSNSVSTTPSSTPSSNRGNFLETYRRQRSLSGGEDMVAPQLPKSHKWMVTGRTISLPPNINDQLSEKVLQKSTENLCTGSSSSIQRSQSDLSTLVRRKSGLLLDCGVACSASDDHPEGKSLDCEKKESKTRRKSMPDLGVQRQDSGGDLIEAVIPGPGVPKSLLAQTMSTNGNRPCLASTIHEAEREEESAAKSSTQAVLPSPATPLSSEASLYAEAQEKSSEEQHASGQQPEEPAPRAPPPPLFRLGSLNETTPHEDNNLGVEHQVKMFEQPADPVEQKAEESKEGQLEERKLQQRGVRQQVHIMEHVYNGECALKDDCPRQPAADCLNQMSDIIEAHRNGLLGPSMTEWLKSLIRAHCSGCRDPQCRVPHLAVGCAPPGTFESYGSSTGSAIASHTEQSRYQCKTTAATNDPEHLVPAYQHIPSTSVDMDGNMSSSDQVREFYQGPAESAHPLGHRGANFTDNQPTTPQTGGYCALPTNGTPPNNVNPIVYTSPYNHLPLRPNLLPGVYQGLAGPIPATTNDTGIKNLSPYPSTGFLPPPQLYGRAMCRDTMLRSPIQQASDIGNGVLNRDQACYIQPNQGRRRNFLQDHQSSQLSPSELPDVRMEGFPHSSKYSSIDAGVLIYCSERLTADTGFSLGALCRPPDPHKADKLGSGGNGSVFGYFQNGRQFAVKKTTYRQTELQAWLKLDHPNVLPLLGVMWGGHCCYQFMPKMTSDMSAVMRLVGDLCTLVRSESRVQWENVLRPNVCHVLKSLVSGVKYLHDMGIQHYDLKSSNVLICRPASCQCADIFSCECPMGSKCEIRISDFDSVKIFSRGLCATSVPDVQCKAKADSTKVLGTPYYRAPEQFKQMCEQSVSRIEGLEGPWCDMWAVGVIITQLCLGKQRAVERDKVHRTMVSSPVTLPLSSTPTPEVEGFVARERLSTLRERCIMCQQLAPLAEVAALCLEPDFKKRVTADKLLMNDFFSS